MFIDEQFFLASPSPQNYSSMINPLKNQVKSKTMTKLDMNCDYLLRQCVENPHCSTITNPGIIKEALQNRARSTKSQDLPSKSINTCVLIPIKINDDDAEGGNDCLDITTSSKLQIATLELYFSGNGAMKSNAPKNQPVNLDLSQFDDENCLNALAPIFNLLRDIVVNDKKHEINKDTAESKLNETCIQTDESCCSISASFLEANRKVSSDALICFTQTTKRNLVFSELLHRSSLDIPKILSCERALVIMIVETPNSNILGGPTKTAYFYSFSDNHMYNFNYEGTFVDKILAKNSAFTLTTNTHAVQVLPESIKSPLPFQYPKNMSNEPFHTIRYCPISAVQRGSSKVIAILETCYTEDQYQILLPSDGPYGECGWESKTLNGGKHSSSTNQLKSNILAHNDNSYISDIMEEDEKLVHMLDQNASLLSGFADAYGKMELEEKRVSPDFKDIEFQCTKIIGKRLHKVGKNLHLFSKVIMKCTKKLEKHTLRSRFVRWVKYDQLAQGHKVEDFKQQMLEQSKVIEELKKTNMSVHQSLQDEKDGNQDKRRTLAAAVTCAHLLNKVLKTCKIRLSFETWKSSCEINRVMENAFNKVLEMNHKHVEARLSTACNLVSNFIISHNKKQAHGVFDELCGINYNYISGKSSCREIYLHDTPWNMERNRSPTPKFSYSKFINNDVSSSLKDSTLFLSRWQDKYSSNKGKRRTNKSMENMPFLG